MGRMDRPYARLGNSILMDDRIPCRHILSMYSHSTTAFHLGFRANTRLQSPRTHDLLLGFNTHFLVLLARHFRMVSINSHNRGATLREERDGRRIGYISSEGRG